MYKTDISNLMLTVLLFTMSLTMFGTPSPAYAQEYLIPSWVKGIAGFWSEDKIDDKEFGEALTFLFDNDIIRINASSLVTEKSENYVNDLEQSVATLEMTNTQLEEKNSELQRILDSIPSGDTYYRDKIIEQGNEIDKLKTTIHGLENQKINLREADNDQQDEFIQLKNELKLLRNDYVILQAENNELDLENNSLKDQLKDKSTSKQSSDELKPSKPIPGSKPYKCPVDACSDPNIKTPQNVYHTMRYGDKLPSFEINLGDSIHIKNIDGIKHKLRNDDGWYVTADYSPTRTEGKFEARYHNKDSGHMWYDMNENDTFSFWFKSQGHLSYNSGYNYPYYDSLTGEKAMITVR